MFTCQGQDCGEQTPTSSLRPDKAMDRAIKNKIIYCHNRSQGCQFQDQIKKMASHLTEHCQFGDIKCSRCNQMFARRDLNTHKQSCKSRTCDLSDLGCTHVESSPNTPTTSVAGGLDHGLGVHLALIYQQVASCLAVATFTPRLVDAEIKKCRKQLGGQYVSPIPHVTTMVTWLPYLIVAISNRREGA